MPTMQAPAASSAAQADVPKEEAKPVEKTEFSVKLESFDAAAKAKIIREVKALLPGANLVEVRLLLLSP